MIAHQTVAEIRSALAARKVSAVEVAQAFLDRIRDLEPAVHGYLQVADDVLEQAGRADTRIAAGETAPLLGVPVAVKDIISVRGLRNTCASRILESYVPPYDATAVTRLREAGAVILGKTNLDEFAMGSSTENSAFGPTCNPWDLSRVPGGSSGGSAAVVAAGEAPIALGTDTGGSVRQPAAFCGVTGLKPTYGRVSRYGLVAFASSLDQVGVLARDARDCAAMLGVLAGVDSSDATSADVPVEDYDESLAAGASGLRIGVPVEFTDGLAPAIRRHVEAAAVAYERMGASIREVSLPRVKHALPAYYVIAPAEASSNLARYDGVRYGLRASGAADVVSMMKATRDQGFGDEVKRRIMIGTYALSAGYYDAYYLKAQRVRTLIRQDFDAAFAECDLILGPATPGVAFKIGEKTDDPLEMYLSDIYTVAVNLAGLPGVVLPGGFEEGLPVGLQLIGPAFAEGRLLSAAHAFQGVTDFHRQRPSLTMETC